MKYEKIQFRNKIAYIQNRRSQRGLEFKTDNNK